MASIAVTLQLSIDRRVAIEKGDTFAIIFWRQLMNKTGRKKREMQTNKKGTKSRKPGCLVKWIFYPSCN